MTPVQRTDVVIVGAGFAGIGMADRLARRGRESFVVLESADAVGGTWRDNTYPGIACDIPAHLYSFSFRPPSDWSSVYPTGAEIRDYLERTVADAGITPNLRLKSSMQQATWDDDRARWRIVAVTSTASGTTTTTFDAKTLVLAVGRLSEPQMPDVEGLESFPGTVMHTARWRADVELTGARIGVVGTGASAVQIVPELVDDADEVVVFSRTPPYVVPRGDRRYTAAERAEMLDADTADTERDRLLAEADTAFVQRLPASPEIDAIRDRALGHLHAQVPPGWLRESLTPQYEIGCKRILLSDDFYPTLLRENVVFEPDALESVTGSKARAVGGRRHDLDVLVMATGFQAARPPVARRVTGRSGELLADHWSDGMVSYASTTVSGFPNMFVLDGPNAALGHNSAIYMIETQIDYVLGALDHLVGVSSLEVTAAAEDAYTREIARRSASTVWMTGCHSWYLDTTSGRLTLLWPGTAASFRDHNGTFEVGPYVVDDARGEQPR